MAFYPDKIKKTKRPLVITQKGKGAAVLLDVSEYEAMIDRIEALEDIELAEEQSKNNMQNSHQDAKKKSAKRL